MDSFIESQFPNSFRKFKRYEFNKELTRFDIQLFNDFAISIEPEFTVIKMDELLYIQTLKDVFIADFCSFFSSLRYSGARMGTSGQTPCDLRTKAIVTILLATGMRPVDITGLKLDDIDWNNDNIGFIQSKTGEGMNIELFPVMGSAITRYMTEERPNGTGMKVT